ncbi:MAG: hypothetical protein WCE30_28210 [Mycobacterium sp.]
MERLPNLGSWCGLRLSSAPIDVIPNDSAAKVAIAEVPSARFAVDDDY